MEQIVSFSYNNSEYSIDKKKISCLFKERISNEILEQKWKLVVFFSSNLSLTFKSSKEEIDKLYQDLT